MAAVPAKVVVPVLLIVTPPVPKATIPAVAPAPIVRLPAPFRVRP